METKALKKQLGAAIAMVVVAAIALGSATYAWFVSNNTVKAESSTISAQSNSAYLVIDTQKTTSSSTSSKSLASEANKALYPASIEKKDGAASWYTNYAESTGATTAKANDAAKFTIKDTTANSTNAEGSAAAAVAMGYAIKETFYIGTGTYDGTFSNLKVSSLAVKNPASEQAKNLGNAMRVLVVCGANWQVWKAGTDTTACTLYSGTTAGDAIASEVKKGTDAQVDVYVYYEGSEEYVYSDNLSVLSADQNSVTITFTATPTEYGKTTN